jgi:hypothetical protein
MMSQRARESGSEADIALPAPEPQIQVARMWAEQDLADLEQTQEEHLAGLDQ